MSTAELHRKEGPRDIRFAFLTVSTSRYSKFKRGEEIEDESFIRAKRVVESFGYHITRYALVPDNPRLILFALDALFDAQDVDVIVLSGGTGPTRDDVTVQTVRPLFDKELEGFGDVFRSASIREAGPSSFLSNATAGIVKDKVVFLLPGSPNAVETALKEIICPEAAHVLALARRGL
ncbi:MAG: molybdenum cofactor biosynthesis protein B [Infirmifilum sp.]